MNSDLAQALPLFAASAVVVVLSGIFLAKYGDALADLSGWGRLWVGTFLVAVVTSLPELVTNITASSRGEVQLAGGSILGANMVNMLVMAGVALLFGGAGFFRRVAPEQRLLGVVAIGLTGLALLLGTVPIGVAISGVGLASVLVLAVYLAGMRVVYVKRPRVAEGPTSDNPARSASLRKVWLLFSLAGLGVILAAPGLAFSAEQIADSTGIASSFIGVLVVAVVAATPEAATSITALRIGAADLAVGNLFGSCAFNIAILGLADPFYRDGTLLETLESAHIAAGLVAIGLMSAALLQVHLRGGKWYLPAVPTLALMVGGYLGGLLAVYTLAD